jgi:hypothetical protein
MTDDDRTLLNRRIETEAFGDDGSCFDADGKERLDRIKRAIKIKTKSLGAWWTNRLGHPWQADIEAHVAAYREPPRDFAGDNALAMTVVWPRLRTFAGQTAIISLIDDPLIGGWDLNIHSRERGIDLAYVGHCDTIAEAVCLAWAAMADARNDH